MAWVLVDVEIDEGVVSCYADGEYVGECDIEDVEDCTDWQCDGNNIYAYDSGSDDICYYGSTDYAYYVWIDD